MEKTKLLRGLIILSLISLSTTLEALPVAPSPSLGGDVAGIFDSISHRGFTGELKLVVQDLQNGKRRQAKLRLGRYLAFNKDDPQALNLAGLILLEEHKYADAEESFRRLLKQGVKTDQTFALSGVSAYMQGKRADAERQLNKALVVNPEHVLALRYLALIEVERNNTAGAIRYYQKILATPAYKNQTLTNVHLNLTDALASKGDIDKAIDMLTVKNIPVTLQKAHAFALASVYARTGQVDKSLAVLDNAKVDKDQQLSIEIEKVRILSFSGKKVRAVEYIDSLIVKYPDARSRLYFDRGIILAEMKNFDAAGESILRSAEFSSQDVQSGIKIKAAEFFFLADDAKKSRKILNKALENEPDNLALKYAQAELFSKTQSLKAAADLLDEVIASDKTHYKAHYLRGVIAWNQQQLDTAFSYFNNAVNVNPQFIDGWMALAEVEHVRSSEQKMQDVLEQGLKNNPGSPVLRYSLASQSFSNREHQRTLSLLENFPENSQGYGDAQSLIVLTMIELNKPPSETQLVLKRAKELAPTNVYLSDAEGYYLAKNGKSNKAVKILARAAEDAKDDALIYLHLSEALLMNGEKDDAEFALLKAMTLGVSSKAEILLAEKLKSKL